VSRGPWRDDAIEPWVSVLVETAGNCADVNVMSRSRFRTIADRFHAMAIVLAGLYGVGGGVAWGAYSSTTDNPANSFSSTTWATVRSITAGDFHSCLVKYDRTAWCWGRNDRMQLGDGTSSDRSTPVQVLGPGGVGTFSNADSIQGGKEHTCARKSDTTVWCWGRNNEWQLGDGTNTDRSSPVQVLGAGGVGTLSGAQSLDGGGQHNCVVKTDATVWCWGRNNFDQLGEGSGLDRGYPVQVKGPGGVGFLTGVVDVTGALEATCALKTDGTVWCWGRNDKGQLGDGTSTDRTYPVQVVGSGGTGTLTGVSRVGAGDKHVCARKTDQTMWCWGQNADGQLGDSTSTDRSSPVQVKGAGGTGTLTSVILIFTGSGQHTCAVRTDMTMWCWGRNNNGQLGDNTTTDRAFPVQVVGPGGSGTLAATELASAGGEHTCAVANDDATRCWGRNDRGQLGDGTTSAKSYPVSVSIALP
jgi:alpha-tubulin suppressor-like RCC1 family protein